MPKPLSIGWVVDSSPKRVLTFPWQTLSSVAAIRYAGLARYLHQHSSKYQMSLYRPWKHYDAVVFVKMMNPACHHLAQRLKRKGTKILFDANVNYYEMWGNYPIPGTRPAQEQMEQAIQMTMLADHVVADSSYLRQVCLRHNPNVTWIPDAVDTELYHPADTPRKNNAPLRLIWSGVAKKAHHLELLEPILEKLYPHLEILLVSDKSAPHNPEAPVIRRLLDKGIARTELFDDHRYANQLRRTDVIVSPKILENAYEAAHTEYKITLGMSAGLPALASPQQSYEEALQNDGGWICRIPEEWHARLEELIHHPDRIEAIGRAARQRVLDHYSIPVVAARYAAVFDALFKV